RRPRRWGLPWPRICSARARMRSWPGCPIPPLPDALRMDPRTPVMLTRPAGRNESLARALRAAGLAVIEAPALAIERLAAAVPARRAGALGVCGRRQAVEALCSGAPAAPWPAAVHAAAVGAAAARALRAHVPADWLLSPADGQPPASESLLAVIEAANLAPG